MKRLVVALALAGVAAFRMWTLDGNPWAATAAIFTIFFLVGVGSLIFDLMINLEPLVSLTVLTLLAGIGSLGLVELVGRSDGPAQVAISPERVALNIVAAAIPTFSGLFAVVVAVRAGFLPAPRGRMLARVAGSYVAVIVAFTFGYYLIISAADQEGAIGMYKDLKAQTDSRRDYASIHPSEERAFRGIGKRMWTFLRPEAAVEFARLEQRDLVKFTPYRLAILVDCFHLSVMTMATVGLGDITPVSMIAKLSMDLQVLAGVVLFVVALGMIFGRWWDES